MTFMKNFLKELYEALFAIMIVFALFVMSVLLFNRDSVKFYNNAVNAHTLDKALNNIKKKHHLISLTQKDEGLAYLFFTKNKYANPFFRMGCVYTFEKDILKEKKPMAND